MKPGRIAAGLGLVGWLFAQAPAALAQNAAEIVSLIGKGEYRPANTQDWKGAKVPQGVEPNAYVRTTLPESKMSLLLADQTQVNLQGVSILQVKAPDASAPKRSIVDFGKGTGRFQTKTPTKDFQVRTPTGLAAIRGTEWLVEVDDAGTSRFTVVEGEIELSNDQGTLAVGADEQGTLERGKAPTKRRVQNARERVQWVSALRVDPQDYAELRPGGRLAGPFAAVLALVRDEELSRARAALESHALRGKEPVVEFLLADLALYFGEAAKGAAILEEAQRRFPAEPRTEGLLARAWLVADDHPRARAAAARALREHPGVLESQLHAGEVARLDGDAVGARRALTRATQVAPGDWRAWHALGRLHAERSDPRKARRALGEAQRLAPGNAMVLGERGLVEADAYDLPLARATLERAIAAQPDDFAGWTGLGLARLKSGDPEGALEALLKATLLEPRYAKAHVYTAVAYWQLARREDAMKEIATASVHDPRDPLPYQMRAMMQADLMRPGDALDSAREALARLPFVKSLDAIATNLRGSANLGAPLAQLGLEAWATKNAQDSFDPLWAGSHLFLADRLPGKFTANSELFQGFLADPLAFGASNRFQSLIGRTGSYGTLALRAARSGDSRLTEPLANVNGLTAEGRFAYFVEGAQLRSWQPAGELEDRAASYTVGLGLRPRDDLGFFLYGNRLEPDSRAGREERSVARPFSVLDGAARRLDAGAMWRPGPDTMVWVKGGDGREDSRLSERTVGATGAFRDSDFTTTPRVKDLGARLVHRYATGFEVSAVIEASERSTFDFLARDFLPRTSNTANRLVESVGQDIRDRARGGQVAVRWPALPSLLLEGQLDYTRYDKVNDILVLRDFINQRVPLEDDHALAKTSPRAGLAWRATDTLTLRAAWQRWLRPASTASLGPSSTAGITLDERYVLAGGTLERLRGQVEWEATPRLFVSAFADRQDIDNLYSTLIGVLNNRPDTSNLERLRNRSFNALASLDVLEGFPDLSKGRLTEGGAAVNWVAFRQASLFAEAAWANSRNTGASPGAKFALLPRTRAAVGGTWFTDARFSLAAKATWRGERFRDEANTQRLPAEWSGAVQAYWESQDKRLSVEGIVSNLGAKSADTSYGVALNLRF